VAALLGLTRVYLAANETEQAQATLDLVPETERKGDAYGSLVNSIRLLGEAANVSETAALEAAVAANPDDHQARFDLALALNAENKRLEAAEALVTIFKRDRAWNEDGARRKLLEFFDAWGPKDPATTKGRRLLSAAQFSRRSSICSSAPHHRPICPNPSPSSRSAGHCCCLFRIVRSISSSRAISKWSMQLCAATG
jgi:putative thioredoxin